VRLSGRGWMDGGGIGYADRCREFAAGGMADDSVGWVITGESGYPGVGADHGDPLGHHCDRPDQADREHGGDTDRYAHLDFLWVGLSFGEIGLPYF
jgi:hypothetical protein